MAIQQLKSSKILVIGDLCTDKYHFGMCKRLSPEAPVPIFKLIETQKGLGMAGNVYQNLLSLGNKVDLTTNKKRITKERFVDLESKQHIMRLDTGESRKISPFREYDQLNIDKYDCIVISDYNKGFLDGEAIKNILNLASQHSVVAFADSKKKDLSCYKECFLKINESEFNSIKKLPQDCDFIVTLGNAGARYQEKVYKSYPSDIDNTGLPPNICGAGDTFLAGLVASYMTEKDINYAIEFANFCASIAVKNFGTYIIKKEDIERWKKYETPMFST